MKLNSLQTKRCIDVMCFDLNVRQTRYKKKPREWKRVVEANNRVDSCTMEEKSRWMSNIIVKRKSVFTKVRFTQPLLPFVTINKMFVCVYWVWILYDVTATTEPSLKAFWEIGKYLYGCGILFLVLLMMVVLLLLLRSFVPNNHTRRNNLSNSCGFGQKPLKVRTSPFTLC